MIQNTVWLSATVAVTFIKLPFNQEFGKNICSFFVDTFLGKMTYIPCQIHQTRVPFSDVIFKVTLNMVGWFGLDLTKTTEQISMKLGGRKWH